MAKIDELMSAKDLGDVASLLGYQRRALASIIYATDESLKYRDFEIKKSGGGFRKISAPEVKIKLLQKRLAVLLQDVLDKQIYASSSFSRISHGFRPEHSIITNARRHKNRRYVFNLDLKEFFPSFNFGRVRGFFIKSSVFALDPKVATIIAQIACYQSRLPQGSPLSPVISNLIGHILDVRLAQLARRYKCTYTRYADDLTFSTNQKHFPKEIAIPELSPLMKLKQKLFSGFVEVSTYGKDMKWVAGDVLVREISKAGFEINTQKTSMQFRSNRQCVTGLVVNSTVNVPVEYYKQARAMCHSLFKTGQFTLGPAMRFGKPTDDPDVELGSIEQLRGVLAYIYQIKSAEADLLDNKMNGGIQKLYENFLNYYHFHANEVPLLICEGKTDILYLRAALRSLASSFPTLATISDGKIESNFRFFRFSDTSERVLDVKGGTGNLKNFILKYEKRLSHIKAKDRKFPVIVLIDNDDAGKDLYLAVNNKFKPDKFKPDKKFSSDNTFDHIIENLYLVSLPSLSGSSSTEIEDYFSKKDIEREFTGKVFFSKDMKNKGQAEDINRHFGKQVFATGVVVPNQKDFDFTKFKKIFTRIEKAIEHHNSK